MDEIGIQVLLEAINHYGEDHQLDIAVEEMSELTKEICKHKRYGDNREAIVEELADVEIMMQQIRMIFFVSDKEVEDAIRTKTERLKGVLENE